jgi:hypothetical protein
LLLASAQPRPPGNNNKVVTVAAGERILEGVRFSNPSSADNLALIKFRDGLTGVVSREEKEREGREKEKEIKREVVVFLSFFLSFTHSLAHPSLALSSLLLF